MIRRIAICAAGAAILFASSAYADLSDDLWRCIAARYSAAGQYARCEAKAAAKGFDGQAFLKCRQKYAATWAKLVTKYPGTSCAGPRFTDNGLTITDNLTQLVWEKKATPIGSGTSSDSHDVDNRYSISAVSTIPGGISTSADGSAFTDFLDDLNSTGFAGQHDWRLPTLFELQSILSTDATPCATPPCVADPLFSTTQSLSYWSSSTRDLFAESAWQVNFETGDISVGGKTDLYYVRAVRSGP